MTVLSSFRLIATCLGVASFAHLQAQEIPRPSQSRAAEGTPSLTRPYNLKLGPVALTANAGLSIEFVDNLNYTAADKSGDIILRPTLGIQGVWQVTKLNNLELHTSLGYTKYLDHPGLDSQTALISPDSEIRLNIYVGDVKFIFHEQFSLQEDPVGSSVPGGVAQLGRFTNTVGVTALWDLNDVVWSLGFDHYNFITTGKAATVNGSANSNLSSLDHSTEQLSSAVSLKFGPTVALGLEGTAAYSRYSKNSRADSTSFSLGPYLDMQLTRYTHLTLGAGYQLYSSEGGGGAARSSDLFTPLGITGIGGISTAGNNTNRGNQGGDGDGYYFNLSIVHRLNSNYQDRLSIGREFQIGLLSDRTETTFIRYSSTWAFSRRLSLASSLSYEDVKQTSQTADTFGGGALPSYRFIGAALGTSYQLTKKLSVSLNYQYSRRLSEIVTQEFAQNRFAIQFGYQF